MVRTLFALVFGLCALSAIAQTVTINFDRDPNGNPVANGTIVDALYTSQGVTFSATSTGACGSTPPHIYANNDDPAGFTLSSPPNVVTTCTGASASDIEESTEGAVRADFSQSATQVCIDVFPDGGTQRGFIRAYDATFTLLSTVNSTAGALQNLCVSASGIRRVEFSGDSSTNSFARFDNLVITFAPAAAATPVPALGPAGLVLLFLALVLIGLWTAHRRKI
jgi:hypothetical protein